MRPFLAFASSWRRYAAGCRMLVYVRTFRHEVSKTYTVLDEAHDDGRLLYLVFGKNKVLTSRQQETPRTRAKVRRS